VANWRSLEADLMANSDLRTCPRHGVSLPPDAPAGLPATDGPLGHSGRTAIPRPRGVDLTGSSGQSEAPEQLIGTPGEEEVAFCDRFLSRYPENSPCKIIRW
jgi:hypothetical protein